jgi:YD repeat-containing protein
VNQEPGFCERDLRLPCACEQLYKYNTTVGTLDTLVHPNPTGGTYTTRFTYDNQLRLLTTSHPGSVSTTLSYNADGRVATRSGPSITDALTYDHSGRVIGGSAWVPIASATRTLSLGYGGLGALQWSQGMTEGISNEEYKTDALGNRLWVRDPAGEFGFFLQPFSPNGS